MQTNDCSINGETIRAKRAVAHVSGAVLCRKIGISRAGLCEIELGHRSQPQERLIAIDAALDELIVAKRVIEQAARAAGWPGPFEAFK